MFLIMTVTEKSEQLDFHQVTECENCGRVGAVEVFMIYRCFCLFFLPVWKFDRRYYAKMNCCGSNRSRSKIRRCASRNCRRCASRRLRL